MNDVHPSEALTRGTLEWWNMLAVELWERDQYLNRLGHDETEVVGRDAEGGEIIRTIRVDGATPEQRAALQAQTEEGWRARVEYGLANGEFRPPVQSAWERFFYGSDTSPWSWYTVIQAAAFWAGMLVVGGLAFLAGGTAAGLTAAAVTGTTVSVVLGKWKLSMVCGVFVVGVAGYDFGPKQYVNLKERQITPTLSEDPADFHTHWIGVSLALAGLFVLVGLAVMLYERWDGRRKSWFRRVGRTLGWVLGVLAVLLSLISETWAATPVVFIVGRALPFGIVVLAAFVGPALLEGVTARPPIVRRREAFFKELYDNPRWPPNTYRKLSARTARRWRRMGY